MGTIGPSGCVQASRFNTQSDVRLARSPKQVVIRWPKHNGPQEKTAAAAAAAAATTTTAKETEAKT